MLKTKCYEVISEFYKGKYAKRSGRPYMAHIDEGLVLLEYHSIDADTKDAYCLHPLIQDDNSLSYFYEYYNLNDFPPKALAYAFEYRNIANQYLSKDDIESYKDIVLSPIHEVNAMLVADKVQNKKDLELFNPSLKNNHRLYQYFNNWLKRLDVSEEYYNLYLDLMKTTRILK